jgi:hypothetical protein
METTMDSHLPDVPRQWVRFSNEPRLDPQFVHTLDRAVGESEEAEDNRHYWVAVRWLLAVTVLLVFLGVTDAAGFDLGPAGSQRAACNHAGGHETDLLLAHRCSLDG